jgi:hypothetical protein
VHKYGIRKYIETVRTSPGEFGQLNLNYKLHCHILGYCTALRFDCKGVVCLKLREWLLYGNSFPLK